MADTAARLAILARRNEVLRFTIAVIGIDLTGVAMNMQVRLAPGDPGAPKIQLGTVTTLAAEGLKLDGVTVADGVPTSLIKGRINQATMSDATKVPYAAEQGKDSVLAYAMQWTLNGDANTRIEGAFIVRDSAYGSDNAPVNRPSSYGGSQSTGGSDTGSLTFGDQVIRVSIDGVDIVAPLTSRAETAAARAEAANTAVTALAADIPVARDNAAAVLLVGTLLGSAPVAVPIAGNPNRVRADIAAPVDGAQTTLLFPLGNTGAMTLIAGGIERRIARDAGGKDTLEGDIGRLQLVNLTYSAGGGSWVRTRVRDANERDPLAMLRPYLIDNPYGDVVNTDGKISTSPVEIGVQCVGSSIGNGFGGIAGDAPVDMFVTKFNARRRAAGVRAVADNRSVDGQALLDFAAQAAGSTATQPRKIKLYIPLMNDMFFRYYAMRHTFPLMKAGMKGYLDADALAGVLSVVLGSPHPNFRTVNLADGLPTDAPVSWPFNKDAPVSAADIRDALGPDLTDALDWTGSGILTRGVRTFAHGNTWLRDLCRNTPTAVFGDTDWAFRRFGLEPAVQQANPAAAVDALYMPGQYNHFSHDGYMVGYDRVISSIVDAIWSGDLGTRYFRGEPGPMLTLPLLAQSDLGSPVVNNGKIARITYEGSEAFVAAQGSSWRTLQLGNPLKSAFNFANGVMPAGAKLARAAGPYSFVNAGKLLEVGNAADTPRFDCDPTTGAVRGLLVEPARTNLQAGSGIIDAPNFRLFEGARGNGSGGPNGATSSRIARDGRTSGGTIFDQYPSDYGSGKNAARTVSFYATVVSEVLLKIIFAAGSQSAMFNVANGMAGAVEGGATSTIRQGPNGFFRVSMSQVKTAEFGYWQTQIDPSAPTSTAALDFGCYQLEDGPNATSYIPTGNAPATRPADVLTLDWGSLGVPDSTITARYTFDDLSTQDVATVIAGGKSTVPNTLNRFCIRRVELVAG